MDKNITIISLGGSLIVPDGIDTAFLKGFKRLIDGLTAKGQRFVIICGGGRTARVYQSAAKSVIKLTDEDIDWLGIHATRINSHLMRTIFYQTAHPAIIKDPTEKIDFKESVLIAAGWKPGWSTDYDAVLIAEQLGAKRLINLSNIEYVYDRDPKKFKDAKKIEMSNWQDFRKLLPEKWSPGSNSPFDPIASKLAERLGMEVDILDGKDLKNLKLCLQEKKFKGTTIR
ncbi:UMP kinase [Candidatus Falkowbacteria bacterium]|nr:UMP kinase [Candidatus Falkowbacteria bacterium]